MQINSNNIALTASSTMRELISPLAAFDINFFSYTNVAKDGSRYILTTNPDHMVAWFANKLYLQGNANAKIELYESQAALLSTLPYQDTVKWNEQHFDISHGMYLIQKHQDFCEFFMFATTANHPEVINFYLNHLDVLQKFCTYFKAQASGLLTKGTHHRIITPLHEQGITVHQPQKLDLLIKCLGQNDVKFSARQQHCISLLLEGASTKVIANTLNLSVRTVDSYIDAIKLKLGINTKAALVLKLNSLAGENRNDFINRR